ncbi:hypothetical protein RAD15_22905 [Bradyrhizobium sp. 14AA]
MLSTVELLNGLPADETLRFFATFARFEFAMKQCGYLQRTEQGTVALASRERLAADLPAEFFATIRDAAIAPVLVARPPKDLYVQDDAQPQFGNQDPALTTTRQLLNAVWRVRNNLFHGNKMYPFDRDRDANLMRDALAVIDAIMQQRDDLSSAFHDPQQFF